MAYCGPRGIPHSHFLGGPAEWTADDRDKALAWADRDRQTHHKCGTRSEEWNPDAGGDRDAWRYEVEVCTGCGRFEQAEREIQSLPPAEQRGARIVRRRPTPDRPTRGGA